MLKEFILAVTIWTTCESTVHGLKNENGHKKGNQIASDRSYDTNTDQYNQWEPITYVNRDDYQNNFKQQENYNDQSYANQFNHNNAGTDISNIQLTQDYTNPNSGNEYIEENKSVMEDAPYAESYQDGNTYNQEMNSQFVNKDLPYESFLVGQHIDITNPVAIPSIKHVPVPISKPFQISVPYPVLVPIPQPYPVKVPVYKPIPISIVKEFQLPIEKLQLYPVIKNVPYPVTKHVPYTVEKEVKVNVPQPYPVKIPVVKTIIHSSKNFGKSTGTFELDTSPMIGDFSGFEEFNSHNDFQGDGENSHLKHGNSMKKLKVHHRQRWSKKREGSNTNHKHVEHKNRHHHRQPKKQHSHGKHRRYYNYENYENPRPTYYKRSNKMNREDYDSQYY